MLEFPSGSFRCCTLPHGRIGGSVRDVIRMGVGHAGCVVTV
jgi:hypothetical protein